MRLLLLLFIGIPLIEIALFIQIGGMIGMLATIGIVIATAIIGSLALRAQGLSTLNNIRVALDRGRFPADDLRDGALLIAAAALLLTPGFFTDAIGFSLFFPTVRQVIGQWLFARLIGQVHVSTNSTRPRPSAHDDMVIDGIAEEIPGAPSHDLDDRDRRR